MVWHGLLAVAERLWSPVGAEDAAGDPGRRLDVMSCFMRTMHGVPVGPLSPGFCPADVRWPQ